MSKANKSLLMLYDGKCNVCNWAVQFSLNRVRRGCKIEYASLQSAFAKRKLEEVKVNVFTDKKNPEVPTSSLVVVDGKCYDKSDASIETLKLFHGLWPLLAFLLRIVPKFLRDAFYDWFAANRFRFFGGTDFVQPIDESKKDLFLDADEGIHACPMPKKMT